VVASAAVGPLPPPLDLRPKTATVRIGLPKGFAAAGAQVVVVPNGNAAEITKLNNAVTLK
jgi:hypothetical protein